jgi:hypothetical protein
MSLGASVIIGEFAVGLLLCMMLAIGFLARDDSGWQFVAGLYYLLLCLNYVTMLIYGIGIVRSRNARSGSRGELQSRRRAMAKFRPESLWMLVPLAPLAAFRPQIRWPRPLFFPGWLGRRRT